MIHFSLILRSAMASSAVSSVLHLRDTAGNHAETRTGAYQQVSTNGNSVLDYAFLVNLVINTLMQCQKSVMDCVATHPSRHKKLASIHWFNMCEEWSSP